MTSIKSFPFKSILEWFKKHGRHDLPWRQIYHLTNEERLYHVWVAEVMLQQTQVERVVGYYNRFLEKYPTIESLASTTYEELFPYWQGLGYYSRARRMIELAKIIVEKYDGIFPEDFGALQNLPGIGKYTAQALLAFGYNQPMLAVDANLEKIFARYYFGTKFKRNNKDRRFAMAKEIIKKKAGILDNFDTLISQLQKQCESTVRQIKSDVPIITDGGTPPTPSQARGSQEQQQTPPYLGGGGTAGMKLGVFDNSKLVTFSGRDINNALMDFGAIASLSYSQINVTNYPLPECKWFQTKGTLEIGNKKKSQKISPLKHLRTQALKNKGYVCLVFIHENHAKYWSSATGNYEPFLIEPIGKDDRKTVQDYFSATFGLEVSVRPSFGNGILIPGLGSLNPGIEQTVKLFHAQIQTGKLSLPTFSKKEKNDWIKNFLSIF